MLDSSVLLPQGQPVAAPSTDVSLRMRPPQALNKRKAELLDDFREYIKEVCTLSSVQLENSHAAC